MLPLLVANIKIIVRDRQTLGWALLFPLIFVVALAPAWAAMPSR